MESTEKNENEDRIKSIARKISDGLYINVNRIPTHNIDYDGDAIDALGEIPDDATFERIMNDNLRSKDSIFPEDKDQGDETIGIP